MSTIEEDEKLKRLNNEIDNLNEIIDDLSINNTDVKRFLKFKKEVSKLEKEASELIKTMKYKEYDNCKHLLVSFKTKSCRSEGCVKCGLDVSVLTHNYSFLKYSFDKKIMYDYLYENFGIHNYSYSGAMGNFELAKAIYKRIKRYHPDIDDETASKYLCFALYKMRSVKVSDNRIKGRVRRLHLSDGNDYFENK